MLDSELKELFKAVGSRLDEGGDELEQIKAEMKSLTKRLRSVGLAARAGIEDEYKGFWPHESMAKDFGLFVMKSCGLKIKDMSTTVGTDGGNVVPDDLASWLIQKLGKYGKFRRDALVVKMGSMIQLIPKMLTDLTTYCIGEGAEITKSDIKFGLVEMKAKRLACLAVISNELDEDSAVGIGEIIGLSMTRSIAKKEDLIGFLGDGSETYFGMTGICGALLGVDDDIANIAGLKVASGNAYSEIILANFEDTVALLPEDADEEAKWYMSKKFYYGVVVPLARAAGVVNLFEILSEKKARFLYGYEVVFVPCMPSVEADSQIVAILGDLGMAAIIGERHDLNIARSEEVLFMNGQIAFRGIERVDVVVHGVGDTDEAGSVVALITAAA